jgi:hypothetical protein
MSVYIIRHGRILCADYEMDIVYYPSRQAAKKHLHGFGFKWDAESHLYLNHDAGKWAAIDRFSEAQSEKVRVPISRPIPDKRR